MTMRITFAGSRQSSLVNWRERLRREDRHKNISKASVDELCVCAKKLIETYHRTPRRLGPAALSKTLDRLSQRLAQAKKAADAIGPQGVTLLCAVSSSAIEDAEIHQAQNALLLLERWAKQAAAVARNERTSFGKKRGPTPDLNLKSLVTSLAFQYSTLLALKPTHSDNRKTGVDEGLFATFVKAAMAEFLPPQAPINWNKIDAAVAEITGAKATVSTFLESKTRNSG